MAQSKTSGAGWVASPRVTKEPMATDSTPGTDPMHRVAEVLERLASQPQGGLTAEQLTAIVEAASSKAANQGAESLRAVLHPQNAQHPGRSAFSYPEGDVKRPKAVLRPKADGLPGVVFFCGAREDADQLTPQTIDLYNRFTRTVTSRDGRWKAEVASNGVDLSVWVPCKSIDDRMDLPPLDLILTELLDGQAAVDPISLAERVSQLEALLAEKTAVAVAAK